MNTWAYHTLMNTLRLLATHQTTKRKGFKYNSCEEYVLSNGIAYQSQKLTGDELKLVLNAIGHKKFPVKQCFYNSMILASNNPELTYVEGYILSSRVPLPILHAWITINNKIVDVTLRCYERKGRLGYAVLGEFDEDTNAYFGVAFSRADVLKYMFETSSAGSLIDDWMRGYPLLRK